MTEENENRENENRENENVEPQTMSVDLGGGVTAELPVEDAKKYISWKDSRTAEFNQLKTNYDATTKSVKELSEKAKLAESIKESQYEEVKKEIEGRIVGEYEGQIAELRNKLVGTAVDNAIVSNEAIVADEAARGDLRRLFMSSVQDLSDDPQEIGEKLSEFVKEKKHFLRAQSEGAKPPVSKSKVTSPAPTQSYEEALREVFKL